MALADGKECGKTNFHGLRDLNPMSDITAAVARGRALPRSLAVGFGRSPENSIGVARQPQMGESGGRGRGQRRTRPQPPPLPSRRRVGNGFEFPFRGINWG